MLDLCSQHLGRQTGQEKRPDKKRGQESDGSQTAAAAAAAAASSSNASSGSQKDKPTPGVPWDERAVLSATRMHLSRYSKMGLRTLVLAYRDLSASELADWVSKKDQAEQALGAIREEALEELADETERGLTLLGATGVEDWLQEGVAETLKMLREAGIAIWMLTGDKRETSVAIARSCGMIGSDTAIAHVAATSAEACRQRLLQVAMGRGFGFRDDVETPRSSRHSSAGVLVGGANGGKDGEGSKRGQGQQQQQQQQDQQKQQGQELLGRGSRANAFTPLEEYSDSDGGNAVKLLQREGGQQGSVDASAEVAAGGGREGGLVEESDIDVGQLSKALVIDGESLTYALNPDLQELVSECYCCTAT